MVRTHQCIGLPRIGIVLPSYNSARFIEQTLNSIRKQDRRDWECIVIDDGSTDGTPEIVEHIGNIDPRVRLTRQANAGVATSRTCGLGLLSDSVEFVVFMDHDDLFWSGALNRLVGAIESSPGSVGAHGLADMIDTENRPIGTGGFAQFLRERRRAKHGRLMMCDLTEPTTFEVTLVTVFWPPGTIMLRREVVAKVGAFDNSLRAASDWDMWIRVARHGHLVFLNEVVVQYRRHDRNESNDPSYIYREARYVRRKAFFSAENSVAQRLAAKQAYRAWQIHKIGEKQRAIRDELCRRQFGAAIRLAAQILGHAMFCLRGYPTLWG